MSEQNFTAPDDGSSGGPRSPDFSRLIPQRSIGLKLLLVCLLALLMAIPLGFVWALISDRSSAARTAMYEVAALQGGEQAIMGPAIAVPYDRQVMVDNKPQVSTGLMVLYADTGSGEVDITSNLLTRGLQDVPVYSARTRFDAMFQPDRILEALPSGASVRWADANVFLTLTDLRGAKATNLVLDGRTLEFAPVDAPPKLADTHGVLSHERLIGASVPWLEDTLGREIQAQADIDITGAQRIALSPFAKNTSFSMKSNWSAPSFEGGVLPDDKTITGEGFTATWRISSLARGAAGVGADLSFETLKQIAPGVRFLDLGNPYQSVERALKYAPMFLGLVFLTYFMFETTSGRRAHPAQYILVGLAQLVFYMLLLSVSETFGFLLGFIIAASATVLTISGYAGAVFKSRKTQFHAFVVFSVLYGLIFLLLRMESYALLAGSFASFMAIAGTMWMTRNLDWYGIARSGDNSPQPGSTGATASSD